ncbi:MAG: hypothetical protein KAQ62_22535 [Cyclobacteriaceae bacterium]|nr:hypothetical protein [Cyclobacteriaceae bacterium]
MRFFADWITHTKDYGIKNQIRNVVSSSVHNIAGGFDSESPVDRQKFFHSYLPSR